MKTAIVRLCCVLLLGVGCVASIASASAQAPAASPAPSPAVKKRHTSITTTFRGNVETVDAAAKSFTIKGKKATRSFKVTSATTLLKRSGGNAAFEDLKAGEYVTGSGKKTGETQVDAVSVKVGPKGSGPVSNKKAPKKAAAAPSPSPAR